MSQTTRVGTHKTSIRTENGTTSICYWSTDVVSFNATHITLRSGGYFTNTTKLRMNQTSCQFDLGFSVAQKNFDWFVSFRGAVIPFYDGMILSRI